MPIFKGETRSLPYREGIWRHLGSIDRIALKVSHVSRIFRSPRRSNEAVISNDNHVLSAVIEPIGTDGCTASCMIWETPGRNDLSICTSDTLNTTAPSARNASTRTCPIWRCPALVTPIVSSSPPFAWSWRMDFPTAAHPGICGATTVSSFRLPPSRTGSRHRGKKGETRIESDYLYWALRDFSGYVAADELYDGPFCVLSIVDNRHYKRLVYEVLDHDPTHKDIMRFFQRFKRILDSRGMKLQGITTDASPLYPTPIREVFGDIPHQICRFHIIADITRTILRAVAKVRKTIRAQIPSMPRGRPRSEKDIRNARKKKRLEKRIAELFEHRYLFVQHRLTPTEVMRLRRISRGQLSLRTLRAIMDEVYRLFDRRCRTHTALAKLAKLRMRVRRFKAVGKKLQKIFSPSLEKALLFLDEELLPSTSNAVERGNRRHRKMQKTVYRIRAIHVLRGRIALDMFRDAQAENRDETSRLLHLKRAG